MNIKRDIKINSKDMNAFYRAIGALVKKFVTQFAEVINRFIFKFFTVLIA